MRSHRIKLFRLLGFTVYLDASWFFLALLIVWTLGAGFFPQAYEGLPTVTYWLMSVAGALGLFASIVLHELAHSVVARQYGVPLKGITLFIFGGVAEMEHEPPSAKSELLMAIAGPIMSVLLGGACYALWAASTQTGLPVGISGVLQYLAVINVLLAIFNSVPAFPLDGGRVLRAALWAFAGNLRKATRIAAAVGSVFGAALIVLGVVAVLTGNLLGGVWWILIGMFVRGASQSSYQHVLVRAVFEGEPVSRFMRREPVTVSPGISLATLAKDYVYRYHYKMYPVVEDDRLLGCVTTQQLKELPREEWHAHTVDEFTNPCGPGNCVAPSEDTMRALTKMQRTQQSRLMVVDQGRLAGIVSLKDLLRFLTLKLDLENDEHLASGAPGGP